MINRWQPPKFKNIGNVFVDKAKGAVIRFETDIFLPGDVVCPDPRGHSVDQLPWILIEQKPMESGNNYKYIGKLIQEGHPWFFLEGTRWVKLMSLMKTI